MEVLSAIAAIFLPIYPRTNDSVVLLGIAVTNAISSVESQSATPPPSASKQTRSPTPNSVVYVSTVHVVANSIFH